MKKEQTKKEIIMGQIHFIIEQVEYINKIETEREFSTNPVTLQYLKDMGNTHIHESSRYIARSFQTIEELLDSMD